MCRPKSADISNDPYFRSTLHRLALKFVRSEAAANRIVERTINVLCDNPDLLEGPKVNEAVFALLRRHAFDENDLTASSEAYHKVSHVLADEDAPS